MVQSINSGAPQQFPASKAFEPNQAPQNPNNIEQTQNAALKPQKPVYIEKNPAISEGASASSSRGSNLDISV